MNSAECYEAHEIGKQLVVSGCDASKVLELAEEALDQIAFLVETFVVDMWPAAVGPRWDHRLGAGIQNGVMKVFSIVGPIGDYETTCDPLDQRGCEKNLAPMAWTGKQAGRVAEAIGGDVQLGA